jgi:DNA polymerase-3 subunit epsilon
MAPWVDQTWLAIDTETTGIDVFTDRIVEVAAVEVHPDGTIGDSYRTVVDPGIEIPDIPASIHGITTARAREEGVQPAEALTEIAARIFAHGHRPVVMFNARFDWPIMLCEAERHGIEFPFLAPVLDPFLVDRMLDQYRKGSRKLVAVAQHYAVELDEVDAHGALADATASARVMRAIIARYPKVAEHSLASVYLRQVRGHERWRDGFVDYKRRTGDPQFDEPPGWPIPALIKGGLPVIETPATADDVQEPPSSATEPATGEGTETHNAPAPPDPSSEPPVPPCTIGVKDVAKLAGEVFRPDYDDAPKGTKTKVVERLRHALTYAQTGGKATSLNQLTIDELIAVHQRLRSIADGSMTYEVDEDGVTFTLVATGRPTRVEWAQVQAAEEAA